MSYSLARSPLRLPGSADTYCVGRFQNLDSSFPLAENHPSWMRKGHLEWPRYVRLPGRFGQERCFGGTEPRGTRWDLGRWVADTKSDTVAQWLTGQVYKPAFWTMTTCQVHLPCLRLVDTFGGPPVFPASLHFAGVGTCIGRH